MKYVALLRGINVGGNSRVEMSRLKKMFEELGFSDVKTYINSGNVIFSTDQDVSKLSPKIEKAIEKEFKLTIKIVLRSFPEIQAIAKVAEKSWGNDADQKTDVLFLWDEINKKDILKQLIIKPEIDHVVYVYGAVLWHVQRKDITRSGLLRIVGTPLYKQITIRNINTLRKLESLMQ